MQAQAFLISDGEIVQVPVHIEIVGDHVHNEPLTAEVNAPYADCALVSAEAEATDRERIMAERDRLADDLDRACDIINTLRARASVDLLAYRLALAAADMRIAKVVRANDDYRRIFNEFHREADAAGVPRAPGVSRMALVLAALKDACDADCDLLDEIGDLQNQVNELTELNEKAGRQLAHFSGAVVNNAERAATLEAKSEKQAAEIDHLQGQVNDYAGRLNSQAQCSPS